MMERETGDKRFPIWLLGDSEPKRWVDKLAVPFDDRHPIIHNIWTSIADKIQLRSFNHNKSRVDTNRIFIRNAVNEANFKPKGTNNKWENSIELLANLSEYENLIKEYKPRLILSFGAFAFEFGRRCLNEGSPRSIRYWGAKNLGEEFKERIINDNETNLIPLLHRSIAGGKFIESHEYFCGNENSNYFEYVSEELYHKLEDLEDIFIL